MKALVPINTLETVDKALVQPYCDYCSPLWDNCGKFQSRAARVLIGTSYDMRSADILDNALESALL